MTTAKWTFRSAIKKYEGTYKWIDLRTELTTPFFRENFQHLPHGWKRDDLYAVLRRNDWWIDEGDTVRIKIRSASKQKHYELASDLTQVLSYAKHAQSKLDQAIKTFANKRDESKLHQDIKPALLARAVLEESIAVLEAQEKFSRVKSGK
jgi:hypothetical protein